MSDDTPDTGTPDAPDAPDTPDTGTPDAPPSDPAAEAAKWKALAQKHESRARQNAAAVKELEQLKQSSMSDQEKAIAEAEARGRSAATADVAQRLAAAEIRAALTGVVPDPAAIVEDLNLAKYVGDDGEVNADAVKALAAKYAGLKANAPKPPPGSADNGARGSGSGALTKDQLKTMTAQEIARYTPEQVARAMSAQT